MDLWSCCGLFLLRNIMIKTYRKHIIAVLLLFLLMAIRLFEKRFFDDGLIDFFKHDYLNSSLPAVSAVKVLWVDSVRYGLNAIISILILHLYFKSSELGKFLGLFFVFFYFISLLSMLYALQTYQAGHYLVLFYSRRFLIQPLLLLLLFPALWMQQKNRSF